MIRFKTSRRRFLMFGGRRGRVRALTVGPARALPPALETPAWLAALLLVFVPLSVRAFRRA